MTWVELKARIKQRYIPENSAWATRDKLLRLKHTTSLKEFVKEYARIMLEILDMEESRLYHFMATL